MLSLCLLALSSCWKQRTSAMQKDTCLLRSKMQWNPCRSQLIDHKQRRMRFGHMGLEPMKLQVNKVCAHLLLYCSSQFLLFVVLQCAQSCFPLFSILFFCASSLHSLLFLFLLFLLYFKVLLFSFLSYFLQPRLFFNFYGFSSFLLFQKTNCLLMARHCESFAREKSSYTTKQYYTSNLASRAAFSSCFLCRSSWNDKIELQFWNGFLTTQPPLASEVCSKPGRIFFFFGQWNTAIFFTFTPESGWVPCRKNIQSFVYQKFSRVEMKEMTQVLQEQGRRKRLPQSLPVYLAA